MVKRIHLLLYGLVICCSSVLYGQDFHYSQFSYAPLHLNPGLTGVFAGDTRVNANYRSQWNKVPVGYKTFSVTADHKYTCGSLGPGFFSSGLALNHDRAGDSRLQMSTIGLYGSYTHPINKQSFITLGVNAGFGQRKFAEEDLRFDNQFDMGLGVFNPTLSNEEHFANTSHLFFDAAVGFNLRWQAQDRAQLIDLLDKRSKFDVGIGVHHLTRPDMSFIEDVKVNLPMRINPYAIGTLQVGDPLDIRLGVLAQFQQKYREYLGTAGLQFHFNRTPGRQRSLMLGVGYRFDEFGDAWYPAFEFNYNEMLRASISYDINISDFNVATNRRGGLELSVRYLIKKVCPLPKFKFCPLI